MGIDTQKPRHLKRKDNEEAVPLSTLRKPQLIFEDVPEQKPIDRPEYRSFVPSGGARVSTSNVYGYFDPKNSFRRPLPPSSDRTAADVEASKHTYRTKLSYGYNDGHLNSNSDEEEDRDRATRQSKARQVREAAATSVAILDLQNQMDALKEQAQASVRATIQDAREQMDTLNSPVRVPEKLRWWHRIPACYILITLGMAVIAGSLAVGLYYSIAQDRMGDGFTTAGFMVAVGTLVLAAPMAKHYPKCRCWGADEALLP